MLLLIWGLNRCAFCIPCHLLLLSGDKNTWCINMLQWGNVSNKNISLSLWYDITNLLLMACYMCQAQETNVCDQMLQSQLGHLHVCNLIHLHSVDVIVIAPFFVSYFWKICQITRMQYFLISHFEWWFEAAQIHWYLMEICLTFQSVPWGHGLSSVRHKSISTCWQC